MAALDANARSSYLAPDALPGQLSLPEVTEQGKEVSAIQRKICKICGSFGPFTKDKYAKDGETKDCNTCRAKKTKARMTEARQNRRCLDCASDVKLRRRYCPPCLEKHRLKSVETQKFRTKNKLCRRCGRVAREVGFSYCFPCINIRKEYWLGIKDLLSAERSAYWQKTKKFRIENKICRNCGAVPHLETHQVCLDCLIKQRWTSVNKHSRERGYAPIVLPLEDFKIWFKKQLDISNNCCAWCGEKQEPLSLVCDHDHTTGALRGLVCNACNFIEGFGLERLEKVAKVIRSWSNK